jgi:hypothetical protein
LVVGLLTLSVGCQCSQAKHVRPSAINPRAGADAIALFDTNGDGTLSGGELDRCPGLKASLPRLDPAGTGEVTAAMIDRRIVAWRDPMVGRRRVWCSVWYSGKPLAGAEIRFVPEKFLGPGVPTATGVTDARGAASISAPPQKDERPGVPPGFYRVQITKPALAIPAKYNTDTILGVEVCTDEPYTPFRFDLAF